MFPCHSKNRCIILSCTTEKISQSQKQKDNGRMRCLSKIIQKKILEMHMIHPKKKLFKLNNINHNIIIFAVG